MNQWMTFKLHFPLNPSHHVAIITAYIPTVKNSEEVKENLYEYPGCLVKSTHPNDKLVLLEATVPQSVVTSRTRKGYWDTMTFETLMPMALPNICAEINLMITYALLRQANKYKTTWMHPRSMQWHLSDYVVCYRWDTHNVRITRAMWEAECLTDHRLDMTVLL